MYSLVPRIVVPGPLICLFYMVPPPFITERALVKVVGHGGKLVQPARSVPGALTKFGINAVPIRGFRVLSSISAVESVIP
jgi:hypothetical protein